MYATVAIQSGSDKFSTQIPLSSIVTTTDFALTVSQYVDAVIATSSKLRTSLTRFRLYPVESHEFRILHNSTDPLQLHLKVGSRVVCIDFDASLTVSVVNQMLKTVDHPPLAMLLSTRTLPPGDDGPPGPRGPRGKRGEEGPPARMSDPTVRIDPYTYPGPVWKGRLKRRPPPHI